MALKSSEVDSLARQHSRAHNYLVAIETQWGALREHNRPIYWGLVVAIWVFLAIISFAVGDFVWPPLKNEIMSDWLHLGIFIVWVGVVTAVFFVLCVYRSPLKTASKRRSKTMTVIVTLLGAALFFMIWKASDPSMPNSPSTSLSTELPPAGQSTSSSIAPSQDLNKKFITDVSQISISLPSTADGKLNLSGATAALDSLSLKARAEQLRQFTQIDESSDIISKECSVEFEYALDTFQSCIADLATQHGDYTVTNYRGFKAMMHDQPKHLIYFAMKGNSSWAFYLVLGIAGESPMLTIRSPERQIGATFWIMPSQKIFSSMLMIPGKSIPYKTSPQSDYKSGVDEALSLLIADKSERDPLKKISLSPDKPSDNP